MEQNEALFYFRDSNYTAPEINAENRLKQENLKQRLRDKGCQIDKYNQPDELKSLNISKVIRMSWLFGIFAAVQPVALIQLSCYAGLC